MVGGMGTRDTQPEWDAEIWDPDGGTWSPAGRLANPRLGSRDPRLGARRRRRPVAPLALGEPLARGGSRTEFIRGVWDGTSVRPDPLQDSGAISPLARANALIVREAGAPAREAGETARIYLLENGGIA